LAQAVLAQAFLLLNSCDAPMYRWTLLWCVLHHRLVWSQTGCFSYNYLFYPGQMSNLTVLTARECQGKCRESVSCEHFTFWKRHGMCLLAAGDANLVRTAVEGSVTGPKVCKHSVDPICEEIPLAAFPAPTAMQSRKAWTGQQQPTNLQCWPRRPNGFPEPCSHQHVTILEDTIDNWPGRCENMKMVTDLGRDETCKTRCYNSALCGVWSVENFTNPRELTCWQALHGTNCYKGQVPLPMRAQRIMHGNVRVLMNTMQMLIKNLTKAFDVTDVGNNETLGGERCRFVCSSYLFCQYWQYSTKLGCWVEDPAAKEVAYPLVKDNWAMETDTAEAKSVKAGQYIQHVCNVGLRVPFPTDVHGMKFPTVVTHPPSVKPTSPATVTVPNFHRSIHDRDAAGSEKGTLGSQSPSQPEVSGGTPIWLKVLTILVVALCLAGVAGGAYMAIAGHKNGARRVAGGSKKGGSFKRSQRTEQSFDSPSVGNMNSYSEPVAWQPGETVPFMQNDGGQGCYGQPQQQHQHGNYGNSFPRPQQGYMPTQPQIYQPMQQHEQQGYM